MQPESFVAALARASFGATVIFYREGQGAELRRERLRGYLDSRAEAPLLLVGEAPGYRGARVSGLPFTSERQLTGSGPGEATATIVHRVPCPGSVTPSCGGASSFADGLLECAVGGRVVRRFSWW